MSQVNKITIGGIGRLALFGCTIVFSQPGDAHPSADKFNKQMLPILEQYLKIPYALAADKTYGVNVAVKNIEKLASKLDSSSVSGEHAKHFRGIPAKIKKAAQQLRKSKDIKAMRETLKELSKPMALWASMAKPKGISVVYCSMAPGSWLQRGTVIANPYYGSKMLRCGEIVAGDGSKKVPQHKH